MSTSTTPQPRCPRRLRPTARRLRWWRKTSRLLMLLTCVGVFFAFAGLSVGWEIIKRFVFPDMHIGLHHAILTTWSAIITGVACSVVYIPMRRQQQRLSRAAEELACLLDNYQQNPIAPQKFENPHLVRCYEVVDCRDTQCPVRRSTNDRCWQVMGARRAPTDKLPVRIELQRCLECEVFRVSCPDKLTELGESFNNVIFLLQQGSAHMDHLRSQMLEKEKMAAVGQIAAGVAHEVGNPLSSISSVVQMLRRSPANAGIIDELKLIDAHIQRITRIVRQLVTMARPTQEKWELVDVGQVLEEIVYLTTVDPRARSVTIDLMPPENLPLTYALRCELQQVFINLCLNAFDAMPGGGELHIRAESAPESIVLSFKDTGMGIPPEVGRRIFEPFFTTKQLGKGTGLGLAVSYGIIQKHGGTIDFKSVPEEGTVFTVELPVLSHAPKEQHGEKYDTAGG